MRGKGGSGGLGSGGRGHLITATMIAKARSSAIKRPPRMGREISGKQAEPEPASAAVGQGGRARSARSGPVSSGG